MNHSLLPSRYAKALYLSAAERNLEPSLYEAMRNIISAFEGDKGHIFAQTIANPFVSEADKRQLILSAAGVKNTASDAELLNDFLSLLFKNNRIDQLRGIVYAYDTLYRKEKKISRVHVTWAAQPVPDTEKRLRQMIEQRLGQGTMEYSSSVDPELIGGFKVALDNEQLDASVQNELRQLRHKILS